MSEGSRGLGGKFIFCVVFLSTFFLLVSIIPSGFQGTYTGEILGYKYPSYFRKEDIEKIKFFLNYTIEEAQYEMYEYDFTGQYSGAPRFWVDWYPTDEIVVYHETWRWWIFNTYHLMDKGDTGSGISLSEALTYWDSETNCSRIIVSCIHISTQIFITDYNTTRNNLETAWSIDRKIHLGIGLGIDDFEAKLSAWDITARLLMFQAPEVHPAINALIAIPIWSLIAYLVYRLLLLAIPFVGG